MSNVKKKNEDYFKIALLVLNRSKTKFLVCEKYPQFVTSLYIMPGGKLEEKDDIECLKNEIKEELNCRLDTDSLEFIGDYEDQAAGRSDRKVHIRLYKGKIIGNPKPSTEIKVLHWIGKEDANNPKVSPIIRNKIIPDLVRRGIIK